jgi:hypothetical protein
VIEALQQYVDQIQASGSSATVALGLLFVLVAVAMALRGLRE